MQVTEDILLGIVCFIGGAIFGFITTLLFTHKRSQDRARDALDHEVLKTIVAVVIVSVWTISTLISAFYPDRHTPLELHLLMGGVFGVLLNKGANPILDSIIKRVTPNGTKSDTKTNDSSDK